MKKLISLFLFIFIALSVYAQNDHLMLTRTRPLIEVTVNGKKCAMLIDTGSSINILCTSKLARYGVDKNLAKNYTKTISGVREVYTINKIDVAVKGRAVSLFYSVDIDAVCKSMEEYGSRNGYRGGRHPRYSGDQATRHDNRSVTWDSNNKIRHCKMITVKKH